MFGSVLKILIYALIGTFLLTTGINLVPTLFGVLENILGHPPTAVDLFLILLILQIVMFILVKTITVLLTSRRHD